jgi:ribosomal protein S18 acetylase RimI-like enzyme
MEKWEIPGMTPHHGGYLLGDQIFCVQNGFASPEFIEKSSCLIAVCFEGDPKKQNEELNPGGLSWDFMVAVFKGSNVCDVVAVCGLVYGKTGDEQYLYVFDVCTDPELAHRGIGRVLMGAVNRLRVAAVNDRVCAYWGGKLHAGGLLLLLDVDLHDKGRVSPDRLKAFYSKCGYVESCTSIDINPVERGGHWRWCITNNPDAKRQMWCDETTSVCASFHDAVLAELTGCISAKSRLLSCLNRVVNVMAVS